MTTSHHFKTSAMKLFLPIAFALIVLAGCHSQKETQPQTPQKIEESGEVSITKKSLAPIEKSTLQGKIIDKKTGEPMMGAKVELVEANGFVAMGFMTDEEGSFQFRSIENGSYTFRISYIGYNTSYVTLKIKEPTSFIIVAKLEEAPVHVLKPIIYLYPTVKTDINVLLNYDGKLDHTYPKYPSQGWKVTAEPDGTLWDEKGLEYYALFWEGTPIEPLMATTGFIVAGSETANFLEEKLAYLGLNRREANEFIMFWLPKMENNPYNLIHFAGESYEKQAELLITPQPETIIRVMMLTQALDHKIDFPVQDLSKLKKTRKGFTVVEWGGSELPLIKL
jgi:hypothetical protein